MLTRRRYNLSARNFKVRDYSFVEYPWMAYKCTCKKGDIIYSGKNCQLKGENHLFSFPLTCSFHTKFSSKISVLFSSDLVIPTPVSMEENVLFRKYRLMDTRTFRPGQKFKEARLFFEIFKINIIDQ